MARSDGQRKSSPHRAKMTVKNSKASSDANRSCLERKAVFLGKETTPWLTVPSIGGGAGQPA
eukprot:6097125-Pyramimonas_sp.AAC.1